MGEADEQMGMLWLWLWQAMAIASANRARGDMDGWISKQELMSTFVSGLGT
jgi:hypothetical protein